MMDVSVIGTGYVGLVSGTCLAEIGHKVTCIDTDQSKVEVLSRGESPIYELGLSELLSKNLRANRLSFASNYNSIAKSQVVFISVGTPALESGECDLSYIKGAVEAIAPHIAEGTAVVIKSTVSVGTSRELSKVLSGITDKKFYMVNNPEFLREGTAVKDFMYPDRIILGADCQEAVDMMVELYSPLVKQGNPVITMSNLSAEVSKYASNCYLATRISFINEIARLCDRVGADIEEVRKGLSKDHRIGGHFLYPGPGYGGSCFPKDVKALLHTAKQNDLELHVIKAAEAVNTEQKTFICKKVSSHFKGDLRGKRFAFWGVAFKANTDDVRESPALYIAKELINAGAEVTFFDPEASDNFMSKVVGDPLMTEKIHRYNDMYSCLDGCDGLITVTEWREFQRPDFSEIARRLKHPVIFDARNIFETVQVLGAGIDYYAVGKLIK